MICLPWGFCGRNSLAFSSSHSVSGLMVVLHFFLMISATLVVGGRKGMFVSFRKALAGLLEINPFLSVSATSSLVMVCCISSTSGNAPIQSYSVHSDSPSPLHSLVRRFLIVCGSSPRSSPLFGGAMMYLGRAAIMAVGRLSSRFLLAAVNRNDRRGSIVTLTLVGTVWSADPWTMSSVDGCDINLSRWSRLFCRHSSIGIAPSFSPAYFGLNLGCVIACCCLSSM